MGRSNFSVAMANLVMETVSDLQRAKQSATLKDIKARILEKEGNAAEKYMRLVPRYIMKGINLGLIARYGDHYRTKMYLAKRRKRKRFGRKRGLRLKGRRRRRRKRM